jgi:hypothetical protein
VLTFNPAAVGVSPGGAQQLTASFTLPGYTGSVAPTASLHYGLHYTAGSVNCTSGSTYMCTVAVSFAPTLPGGRKDSLSLTSGGTVLGTVLLYGVGQSPFGLIQPGVITHPIANYADYLYESAVDESGTLYIAAQESNTVLSLTQAGVVTPLPITVTSPDGIAVDGTGTLYISQNTYSTSIVTYSAGAGQGAITVVPPAPYSACSSSEYLYTVAVDGLGDLFTNEILCNQLFELKADGSYVTTPVSPAITQPSALAVDSAGNAFIGGYTINELTAGGTQTQINIVGASEGLSVDAAGTLYATRYTGGGVAELAASNYATSLASLDPSASPLGASVGPDGTLFVGNYTNLDVVDRSQGAIAFGEQTANTTSSVQTVSLYNGGNESLTLSGIAVTGTGFAVQAASATTCMNGTMIAPGALCNVAVTLTPPHAGTFAGTLSLTSNSLNTTTTQVVALSGYVYGVYVTPSPNPLAFGGEALDASSGSLPVTLTNNGDLYSAGIGTPSSDNPAFTPSLGTCTASLAVGSTCQLAVTFAPTAMQAYSGTVTLSVSSAGGGPNQTVTFAVTGSGGEVAIADAGSEAAVSGIDASADSSVYAAVDATVGPDAAAPVEPADASMAVVEASAEILDADYFAFDVGLPHQAAASNSNSHGCNTVGGRRDGRSFSVFALAALVVLRKRKRAA